jgi:hypothetical protein
MNSPIALQNFLFRTPYFPFEALSCFEVKQHSSIFKEMLQIATPDLCNGLKKGDDNAKYATYRYFQRACTRCTPFGLFAGCSIGKILGDKTNIVLEDSIKRHTRLDMYYLCTLSQELSKIPEIKNQLLYFLNTTIYSIGTEFRYIEYEYLKYGRKHKITAVRQFSFLKKILKMAENGVRIPEILDYLTNQGIPQDNALDFIDEIIDSQIIISELSPSVTGDDFLDKMIMILESMPVKHNILMQLKDIKSLLNRIDENRYGVLELYEAIKDKIKGINIPFEEKYLFQSDMTKDTVEATLGQDIIKDIKSAMSFLNRITPETKNEDLIKFIQAFNDRYEGREISLMEALDPEMGIGYPVNRGSNVESPLIDNFDIPYQINGNPAIQINNFQTILHQKTLEALSQNKQEIEFTDNDVKDVKEIWNDLPPTIFCMFTVLKYGNDERLIGLSHFSGSCGANLLARFSYTNKEIEKFVREITLKEQTINPDVLFAEIAHLPDSRVGNILSRPHIRDYEILYLANSDLPENKIIRMSDLTVSVKNGQICLKSKKLNQEIVPRLTNAHNYRNNPMPVYKFLCDMQLKNGRGGLFFNWGNIGNLFSFRPRVKYKNIILSHASWTVKISDIKYLFSVKESALVEEVTKWREKQSIPQHVLLDDGDNDLFVDFETYLSIQALFSVVKKRNVIQLSEFLFDTNNVMIRDKHRNSYLNECIVVFYNDKAK